MRHTIGWAIPAAAFFVLWWVSNHPHPPQQQSPAQPKVMPPVQTGPSWEKVRVRQTHDGVVVTPEDIK